MIHERATVEKTSDALFNSGHENLALEYLTGYTSKAAKSALELGNDLLASIEARTRLLYGLRAPEGSETSRLEYTMVRCN